MIVATPGNSSRVTVSRTPPKRNPAIQSNQSPIQPITQPMPQISEKSNCRNSDHSPADSAANSTSEPAVPTNSTRRSAGSPSWAMAFIKWASI